MFARSIILKYFGQIILSLCRIDYIYIKRVFMKIYLVFFTALLVFVSCKSPSDKNRTADIKGIDSTIKPGDNFFMYVNRQWYDSARIPPSQAGVGTYMFMNYPQRLRLQGILDSVAHAGNTSGSIEQKLGDFYASGMD